MTFSSRRNSCFRNCRFRRDETHVFRRIVVFVETKQLFCALWLCESSFRHQNTYDSHLWATWALRMIRVFTCFGAFGLLLGVGLLSRVFVLIRVFTYVHAHRCTRGVSRTNRFNPGVVLMRKNTYDSHLRATWGVRMIRVFTRLGAFGFLLGVENRRFDT